MHLRIYVKRIAVCEKKLIVPDWRYENQVKSCDEQAIGEIDERRHQIRLLDLPIRTIDSINRSICIKALRIYVVVLQIIISVQDWTVIS